MPRYDIPKLADYSGALNANNSMIQAFSNLGRQSQDYLNYDMNKKQNEWEKAFKMDDFINKDNIDKRDYNYKVQRDGLADKQWQDEYNANKEYRDKHLAIQKQAVNSRGGGNSMHPLIQEYNTLRNEKIKEELIQRKVNELINDENYKNAPKHIQAEAMYRTKNGETLTLEDRNTMWGNLPFTDKDIRIHSSNTGNSNSFNTAFNNVNSNNNINNNQTLSPQEAKSLEKDFNNLGSNPQNQVQKQIDYRRMTPDIAKALKWSESEEAKPYLAGIHFLNAPFRDKNKIVLDSYNMYLQDLQRNKNVR